MAVNSRVFDAMCTRLYECVFMLKFNNRPIRGGHEKPSFRLGGGGRLQNAPSANAFL